MSGDYQGPSIYLVSALRLARLHCPVINRGAAVNRPCPDQGADQLPMTTSSFCVLNKGIQRQHGGQRKKAQPPPWCTYRFGTGDLMDEGHWVTDHFGERHWLRQLPDGVLRGLATWATRGAGRGLLETQGMHPGEARPGLLAPAFPPAVGPGQLFWMESYGSLDPSDGNLGKIRGRCHVIRVLHWHPGIPLDHSLPGTKASLLSPTRYSLCPTLPQTQGC